MSKCCHFGSCYISPAEFCLLELQSAKQISAMSSPQSVDTGWETCKENVQPVKAGRKAVALAEVAASPAMALKSHSADIEGRLE